MLRTIVAYIATGAAFLVLDAVWLTTMGERLYRPDIGALMADKPRLAPAVMFYLLYIAGLVFFCVQPGLSQGWKRATINGLFLGLVAYGTYDLTSYAVLKVWTLKVTILDLTWGAVASAVAVTVGTLVARRIG